MPRDAVIFSREERKARRQQMADAVRSGADPVQVAGDFGVKVNTVVVACREHGIQCSSSAPGSTSKTFVVLARLQNDPELTMEEVADECGVSRQRVYQIQDAARAAGIQIPERALNYQGGRPRRVVDHAN